MQKSLKFFIFSLALLLSGCGLFGKKHKEADNSPEKLYREARDDLNNGRYDSALDNFQKLESGYPFGVYGEQAQMDIAYTHYLKDEKDEAIAATDLFIKLHPNHPHVDYMYYLKGLVNFNDKVGLLDFVSHQDPSERDPKAAQDSFAAFKQLVERFPNSIYAEDARLRLKYLINSLAQYEVDVARYYYRRSAYVAAAERAQAAVKNYQGAPAAEEALFIMARSYDALNLTDLRDDADRVLRLNYPNSRFLAGKAPASKHWWKFW